MCQVKSQFFPGYIYKQSLSHHISECITHGRQYAQKLHSLAQGGWMHVLICNIIFQTQKNHETEDHLFSEVHPHNPLLLLKSKHDDHFHILYQSLSVISCQHQDWHKIQMLDFCCTTWNSEKLQHLWSLYNIHHMNYTLSIYIWFCSTP